LNQFKRKAERANLHLFIILLKLKTDAASIILMLLPNIPL
jgi:hypothetical protein